MRVFALLFQAGCAGDEVMGRGAWGRRALAARGDVLFWQPRLCLTFITLYLKESAHMRMQAFPTQGAGLALTLLVIDNFRPQIVGPRRPG